MQSVYAAFAWVTLLFFVGDVHADRSPSDTKEHVHHDELSDEDRKLLKLASESGEVIWVKTESAYIPVASRSARDKDFALRPHPRPADILRVVPGVFVNQHAGGGKANQYFLRGFDADHGTDIALSFDGIPANMVSHGHGQGYADLNWIIPEVVQSVDTFKGPYSPRLGDFATAGAIDMRPYDHIDRSSISLTAGLFNTYRGVAIARADSILGWRPLAALELYRSDGPFENPEKNRRYSVYSHAKHQLSEHSDLKLAATSYMATWNGSGQIPAREVRAGRLERFGSLDPSEGGKSQRHSVYATYEAYPHEGREIFLRAYLVRSTLNLFSNFTFLSVDPVNGDQIEQEDNRLLAGLSGHMHLQNNLGGFSALTTLGFDTRGDLVGTGLFDTVKRERGGARVDSLVKQGNLGAFVEHDVIWAPWLRSVVGIRGDSFGFSADDHLEDNANKRGAFRASPKASIVVSPSEQFDLYTNFGLGFHSNDSRAVVREVNPGTPLAKALGYEMGARGRLLDRIDLAGSLWLLDLDSEIVWVGDEGITEARGRTRRYGIEVEARAEILSWLRADGDITLSKARFRDLPAGEHFVPLAPRFTMTGGVSAQHPSGWYGRLGVRSLSDRPLTEDNFLSAEGFTLFDVTVGYRTGQYEFTLAVDNALNTQWREAQFATTSRVATDPPTTSPATSMGCPSGTRVEAGESGNFLGCEDVHFTPGASLNMMLTVKRFF